MKAGLRRHGDTHDLDKGSDPIPGLIGLIRFNVDNEGGWLYVVTNDSTDIGYGTTGLLLADTSGDGVQVVSDDAEILLLGRGTGTVQLTAGDAPDNNNLNVTPDGMRAQLSTGKTFVIADNSDVPIVTYTG